MYASEGNGLARRSVLIVRHRPDTGDGVGHRERGEGATRPDRRPVRVAASETWQAEYALGPTMTGKRLHLAFLLHGGPVPAAPSVESAYRETHLWVNVSESGTVG